MIPVVHVDVHQCVFDIQSVCSRFFDNCVMMFIIAKVTIQLTPSLTVAGALDKIKTDIVACLALSLFVARFE